jgi:hypothetical protein
MYLLCDAYLKTNQKSNAMLFFSAHPIADKKQQEFQYQYAKLMNSGYQTGIERIEIVSNDYPASTFNEEVAIYW